MTTPSLPTFIPTASARTLQRKRTLTRQQRILRRQQQISDVGLFLFSCGLIALLVHLALS